ncbi:MAG: type II toxin-antitoxin system HicB family antitoxin [Methanosarcinales archaeon Met12]|nr:MAG: type II toxin-antitoxin system HicB family antitoxin [Methanosarcinales archaeon Met12]
MLQERGYRKVIDMKFKVVIREGEDGWYVVECPSLPGCISQGKNRKQRNYTYEKTNPDSDASPSDMNFQV